LGKQVDALGLQLKEKNAKIVLSDRRSEELEAALKAAADELEARERAEREAAERQQQEELAKRRRVEAEREAAAQKKREESMRRRREMEEREAEAARVAEAAKRKREESMRRRREVEEREAEAARVAEAAREAAARATREQEELLRAQRAAEAAALAASKNAVELYEEACHLYFDVKKAVDKRGGTWTPLTAEEQEAMDTVVGMWRSAAMQSHHQAQCNLGVLYANGQGVKQSYTEAAKWYKLSRSFAPIHTVVQ